MRILAALLASLLAFASTAQAADVVLNLEDGKFAPDTVKMRVGDKLVVANRTNKRQWIWGQGGDWAFDYRATEDNNWTHEPGQSLGIVLKFPGKYRIGNSFDGKMHAAVIVEQ
jgi:plastocyanin